MNARQTIRLKNVPVLVTGGAGFVGAHLTEALLAAGAQVFVVCRRIPTPSYFSFQKFRSKTKVYVEDVRDTKVMHRILKRNTIRYVIHMAAQTDVTIAYNNPTDTITTNILGTMNILESARTLKTVKGIIIASSDKAYGKSTMTYKEDDTLGGDHPYEVSKAGADRLAYSYFKTYGVPVLVTRFGNIYGYGDYHVARLIPGIMQAAITKSPLVLRSDGRYVRDYIYIRDVVNAYIFFLKNIRALSGQSFNVSAHDTVSVIDLIHRVESILGVKIPYTVANTAKNEIPQQHMEYGKISKLGWKPQYSLDDGLKETYEWYFKYRKRLFNL